MSAQGGLAEDDAEDDGPNIFRLNKFGRNYHKVPKDSIVRTTDNVFEVESMAQANAMQFEKSINQWPLDWTKEGSITPDHIEVYTDHEGSPAAYIVFGFGKIPFAEGEEKHDSYIDDFHGIRLSKDVASKILEKWMKPSCPYLKKQGEDEKAPREPRNKYKIVYEALKKCSETVNSKDAGWPVYTSPTNSRRVWPTSQRSGAGSKATCAAGEGLSHVTEHGEAFSLPRGVARVTQIDYNPEEFAVQVMHGKRSLVVCQYRVDSGANKRPCTEGGASELNF